MTRYQLHQGDSRDLLKTLAENSFDSIVTDPPYHLKNNSGGPTGKGAASPHGRSNAGAGRAGFMGMTWDGGQVAHDPALWAEALRVAKPGAWLVAFGGTRTYHRLACAIEDAGWELRDSPARGHMHQPEDCPWLHGWMFGSGFPKSHNGDWGGTALKPAWEPIVLARKPLIGTVEENWREHGTGALNIDACRIDTAGEEIMVSGKGAIPCRHDVDTPRPAAPIAERGAGQGRWPANLIHDGSDEVLACFPDAPGQLVKISVTAPSAKTSNIYGAMRREGEASQDRRYGDDGIGFQMTPGARRLDSGSSARFFYCAKASREDRNEGCEHMERKPLLWSSGTQNPGSFQAEGTDRSSQNHHPTVKPTDLMRWLVRLVTPGGGLVLDPFMGSGSTGKAAMLEGLRFTGIDLTPEYVAIARARIEFALHQGHQPSLLEA